MNFASSDRLSKIFTYLPISDPETPVNSPTTFPFNSLVDTKCFVGLEVEVEKLASLSSLGDFSIFPGMFYWKCVEDGSLRNKGKEFVSLPVRGKQLIHAVYELDNYLRTKHPNHVFSQRTGLHIHINVRYMTADQLMRFIILYLVVENLFYLQAGKDRISNNFCVPVNQSKFGVALPEVFHKLSKGEIEEALYTLTNDWKKYTGFNLLPLKTLGTVEFRHYQGTSDPNFILNQVNLILSMRKFALSHSMDTIRRILNSLNTTSTYVHFVEQVFGTDLNMSYASLKEALEDNVTSAKQILSISDSSKHNYPTKDSPLFNRLSVKTSSYSNLEELRVKYLEFQAAISASGVDTSLNHYIYRNLKANSSFNQVKKLTERKQKGYLFK